MPGKITYQHVVDDLEARIRSGELTPGSWLPTYAEMRTLYGIGSTTTQRVHQELKSRGLVAGKQGKGVYVTEREQWKQ